MQTSGTIPLLSADPELDRLLRPEDRRLAEQIRLPVQAVSAGSKLLPARLDSRGAFAALVLDGILLQTVRLADHTGLRLIGPGDLVALRPSGATTLIADAGLRATVDTTIATFGDEFLFAARHLPRLVMGLHDRSSDQSDRMLTQLMICQLSRVDDRLLSILWLLAETWGRVTPSGTVVPVRLTHQVLGGLIGARRSTVTLALKELTERGALLRQSDGWLLLEPPRGGSPRAGTLPGADASVARATRLLAPTVWGEVAPRGRKPGPTAEMHEELDRTVRRLRSEHDEHARRCQLRLRTLAASRERLAATRERIMRERESRRQVPSS
jgi:CRP/FNR family cyclic AMP-dependent transcriptional regulator